MPRVLKPIRPLLLPALLLLLSLLNTTLSIAQSIADKVIVVVGRNRIILQSDLEVQFAQMKQQDPAVPDSTKCFILQQMVLKKLLLEQAERDSVSVTDEDVEGQLDSRIRYFTQLYGSKEKLEQMSGKTVYQIKEEFRETIKEEMIVEKMQGQILENVKISPTEVNAFYKKIPMDSLPFYPATVEVGQVVINPKVSAEVDEYAYNKLADIRKQIVQDGKNFEIMAGVYSDDPGSRDNGGRYDGMTETIGGPFLPSVGFATGLERVLQTMDQQAIVFPKPIHPLIYFIPMGSQAKSFCFTQASQLRHDNIPCEIDLSGKKIQSCLQMANHLDAEFCIVIGDDELKTQRVQIKNLNTRESFEVALTELSSKIIEMRKGNV
ncbi:MAG: hypothetical protein EBX41_08655 [Chitinophagia bacterium]|nr:hypothetical protein [Chitinophagia bacterium]